MSGRSHAAVDAVHLADPVPSANGRWPPRRSRHPTHHDIPGRTQTQDETSRALRQAQRVRPPLPRSSCDRAGRPRSRPALRPRSHCCRPVGIQRACLPSAAPESLCPSTSSPRALSVLRSLVGLDVAGAPDRLCVSTAAAPPMASVPSGASSPLLNFSFDMQPSMARSSSPTQYSLPPSLGSDGAQPRTSSRPCTACKVRSPGHTFPSLVG